MDITKYILYYIRIELIRTPTYIYLRPNKNHTQRIGSGIGLSGSSSSSFHALTGALKMSPPSQ